MHAFSGFADMLATEPNAWIHGIATCVVLFLAWWLQIDRQSFAFVLIAVVTVWVAEAFNTVLEIMVDMVTTGKYSLAAKRAKDIAAAGVLIASLGAVLIGIAVFSLPLYDKLRSLF